MLARCNLKTVNKTKESRKNKLDWMLKILPVLISLLALWQSCETSNDQIKLSKSIQRASENKPWVERTEQLTFDLIGSISNEASYLTFFTLKLSQIPINKQQAYINENKILTKIESLNNDVSEKHFALRVYAESEIFKNCKTRVPFLNSIKRLIPKLNAFLSVYRLPKEDKRAELQKAFNDIEKSIKTIVNEGKRFCDEIYRI